MFSFPKRMAPLDFKLLITVASSPGIQPLWIVEPLVVWIPLVQNWSLTATGIPCIGPKYLPFAMSDSAC